MQPRFKYTPPANEITLSFRLESGKSTRQTFMPDATIECLYQIAYNLRSNDHKDATFEQYKRAINLYLQGNKLRNMDSTLAQSHIQTGSVIRETFKKWTQGFGVDQATLTVIDPLTQENIIGKPYLLDPGCNHVLEKTSLTQWIEKQLKANEKPTCMCCRATIDEDHIAKLFTVRPVPDPVPATPAMLIQFLVPLREPGQPADGATIGIRLFSQAQPAQTAGATDNALSFAMQLLAQPAFLNQLLNGEPSDDEENEAVTPPPSPRR